MSFNGAGTFSLPAGNPVVTNTTVSSTVHNNTMTEIASGLSNAICKDGQTTITANIPMAGYKFTGLAAGSANGNSLRYEQLFTTSDVDLLGPVGMTNGSVSAPSLRFTNADTTGIYYGTENTLKIACNGTESVQFSANGITLTQGRITFPASQIASSDANTLDDYEEGTFTPGIAFGGNAVGVTYTTQTGTYTKIGNRFLIDIVITLNDKGSSTGAVTVTGLPDTVGALAPASVRLSALAAGLDAFHSGVFQVSTTTVPLQYVLAGGTAITNLLDSDVSDTFQILISGQFKV